MRGENNYIIETFDLTKKYGDILAVDNLNLKVEEGTVKRDCQGRGKKKN